MNQLLLLVFLVLAWPSWARQPGGRFTNLSVEQGLSSTSVYTIYQTSDGFLWLGTQNGLNRYDGYSFRAFSFIPGNTTSLSNNWVKALSSDREGNLWVGTSHGLNQYHPATETFTTYFADPNNPNALADNNIWSMLRDTKGRLWIGTNNGLCRYEPARKGFVTFRLNRPGTSAINAIAEDRAGNIWVGTWGGGIARFNETKGTFSGFDELFPAAGPHPELVKALHFDRKGRIWVGTYGNGLHYFNPSTGQYHIYKHDPQNTASLGDNAVQSILEDEEGHLWLGTYAGGLNYLEPTDQPGEARFVHYQNNMWDPNSLQGSWVPSLLADRAGNLWVGHNNGLSKMSLKGERFQHFQHNPANANSIPKSNINVIFEDRTGLLWFGMWGGGLSSFDRNTQQFTHHLHDPANPGSLLENRVWGMCEDRDGTLWIATGGGLDRYDRKTGRFIHPEPSPEQAHNLPFLRQNLSAITLDAQGRLWVGTWGNGLFIYDPASQTAQQFKHDPQHENSLSTNLIKHIFIDRKGTAWVSTSEGGLNRVDLNGQNQIRVRRFMYESNQPQSITSNSPLVSYEDRQGRIWVGTDGGGFGWIDRDKEVFNRVTSIGTTTILNTINGILEDAKGNLWLSTNHGLVCYSPTADFSKVYDVTDGLQSNSFLAGHCKTRSGAMLFGGHNGFNLFVPEQIRESRFSPSVMLTELRLFNEVVEVGQQRSSHPDETPLLPVPLQLSREIVLSYEDYVMSFGFASLDFTAPHKNRYAYKLENFEDRWNYTDAGKRFATYTNLKPGTYVLKVKGTNSDGVWNENYTSIRIIVTPPWWQTWWAYTTYVLIAFGLLLWLRRVIIRRERLKNALEIKRLESAKLQEMDNLKSRFFTNISHEFRTPLTLILGPLEKKLASLSLENKDRNEFRMMHRNAQRLLQLINQLLDISKLEAGNMKLEPSHGDLLAFLKSIVYSFTSLTESKQIALHFHASCSELSAQFDKDKIEKVVSNLLSNACKFTPEGGRVSVQLGLVPATLIPASLAVKTVGKEVVEIVVEDTGIGIPADRVEKIFDRFYQVDGTYTRTHEGTGIGLALTRELVILHGGEIMVSSQEGQGTRFTVYLPLALDAIVEGENDTVVAKTKTEQAAVLAPAEAEPAPAPVPDDSQLPLLLIVEDNDEVRRYISETFDTGYRLVTAANGKEGVEKAMELVPDLVISDLMMPLMDGIELCDRLKTDEKTNHIPVILLTARASVESRLGGLNTGADDYLTKPFHPVELQARVRNLIEGRRKLQAKFSRMIVTVAPTEVVVASADEQFLQKAIAAVEENMGESEFTVEKLEEALSMSKMQLYRKLKALTDQSPNEFIRSLRLKRAAALIAQRSGNISQIAYEVGFNNLSYFAKCFKELYGVAPSEYADQAPEALANVPAAPPRPVVK